VAIVAGALSEQLGAMAFIDELRHKQMVVDEHLDLPRRREEVAARIREFYAAQNIVVDDDLIDQGVKAWFSQRLQFEPGREDLITREEASEYIDRQRSKQQAAQVKPQAVRYANHQPGGGTLVSNWWTRLFFDTNLIKRAIGLIAVSLCLAYVVYGTKSSTAPEHTIRPPGWNGEHMRMSPEIKTLEQVQRRYAELQHLAEYALMKATFPDFVAADAELAHLLQTSQGLPQVLMALDLLETRWANTRPALDNTARSTMPLKTSRDSICQPEPKMPIDLKSGGRSNCHPLPE
jgi:hypothetical protein